MKTCTNSSIEALLVATKETGIELNLFMSCGQNAGENHNIKTTDKSSLKGGKVEILGNDINK